MKSKCAIEFVVAALLLLALPWSPPLRGNPTYCPILDLADALDQFDPLEGNAIGTLLHDIDRIDIIREKKFEAGGPMQKLIEGYAKLVKDTGSALTEEGAKGAFRLSACLVKSSGSNLDFTEHLREAFTKNGVFKSQEFDLLMRQLADSSRFEFDASSRKLTATNSGIVYEATPAGEGHRIVHILKGHTENDWPNGLPKTKFLNEGEIFDLIDEGWSSPHRFQPDPIGDPGTWHIDFQPRKIGKGNETILRIAVKANTNVILSAYPVP